MANISNKTSRNFRINHKNTQNLRTNRNISHYVQGELLGVGGFGSVYTALDLHTKEQAAVKIISIRGKPSQILERIYKEVNILQIVDHPNIVRIYETLEDQSEYMIFMELVKGKQLLEFLRKHGPLKENIAAHVFHQIVSAVKYLHQRGIVHRDIKAQNIIIDKKFNAKLIDFGLATISKKDDECVQYCGSPSYMAPQLLQRKIYQGEKIDVWCLGVLLYLMLEGYLPFEAKNQTKETRDQNIKMMNWHYPTFSSSQAKQLYTSIFTSSRQRISIDQILDSNFFRKHNLTYLTVRKRGPGKRNQEKAIKLTSQILKINEQVVKSQLKEKQFGQVYTVYNLLLKKENIQKFCIQDEIKAQGIKANESVSSKSQEFIQNHKKLKGNINIIKIHKYSTAHNLKKQLNNQEFEKIIKSVDIKRFTPKVSITKYKKQSKIEEKTIQNKEMPKIKGSRQLFMTRNMKNTKITKSQILELLKLNINTDVRKNRRNQYTPKKLILQNKRTSIE